MTISYLNETEDNSNDLLENEVVYKNLSYDDENLDSLIFDEITDQDTKCDSGFDSSEDNIIKLISNIKIVNDEAIDEEDDELDFGMQSFLVEALNESYKIRKEEKDRSVEKKNRIGTEARDKCKVDREAKIKFSKENIEPNIFKNIDIEDSKELENGTEQKDTQSKSYDLKLEELKEDVSELKLEEDKEANKAIEEAIVQSRVQKKEELKEHQEKLDDIIIEKLIDNNSYENFYKVIKESRSTRLNGKVIGIVFGMMAIVVTVLILVTEIVTASAVM